MIDKQIVAQYAQEWLEQSNGYFLVDVSVNKDNIIVVEIDHADGVWVEDCAELSRFIESKLDREQEDFELEVGSAGLGQPFKVLQQYLIHLGQEVEVMAKPDGDKTKQAKIYRGVLLKADEDGFTIQTTNKKEQVSVQFTYPEIKYTKYLISFK